MYPSFLGWKDERLLNIEVDKYLSPKLGKTITMRLFSISDRLPISSAADTAAPLLIPLKSPSCLASCLPISIALASSTSMTSSINDVSSTFGIKPAPIPWIL